ncbi:MAG: hypothetical protein DMG54_33770 [Acidobacteria bacterium]|nr:MAG: hypothetical protein DMG54_33770 [Acidobacteriota bacterium]PYU67805.1 MAG: hypothetical protein DMG52_33100 [Acidobacteriota bacterium]
MPSLNKELIRESRWMRVYNLGDTLLYESKFLADGLQVSSASLISSWKNMAEEEHTEFALAFLAKPDLQSDDEKILNHLMEAGSTKVLRSIALLAVRHSDRERVFRFLTQQIKKGPKPLSNFYQALELLNDRRAVPTLRQVYDRHKAHLSTGECEESELVDYLECCKALLVIDGNSEYQRAISEMQSHSSEQISRMAKRLLESKT